MDGDARSAVCGQRALKGVGPGSIRVMICLLSLTAALGMTLSLGGSVASGAEEPISQQSALGAVNTWFADTNLMWTAQDFATLDQVTTGAGRALYKVEIHTTAKGKVKKPFTLTDLSVAVPCQSGATKTFLAYANTDIFTFGDGSTESAMVFEQVGSHWKFADVVSPPTGAATPKTGTWPKLCTDSTKGESKLVLPVSNLPSRLATTLERFSVSTPPPSSAAEPFAPGSWFVGTTSVSTTFTTSWKQFSAQGDELTQKFAPSSFPTFAWPLANGNGVWVVSPLTQRDTLGDPAGDTTGTWPGGGSVTSPHPSVVHKRAHNLHPNYAAVDPSSKAGGSVTLDGFYGWMASSKAS